MFKRFDKIKYTLRHKKAFKEVENKYFGKKSKMWILHDVEKPILYLLFGVKLGSKIHRLLSKHHVYSIRKKKDWKQMVIDWECARITKPDKPLNAYETMILFYPDTEKYILPILKELGLDKIINSKEFLIKKAKDNEKAIELIKNAI